MLETATAIGDLIVSSAIADRGAVAWHGISYDPVHDLRCLDVLPDDLLTGTLGIAIVLADLFDVTRERRYRETALAALHGAATRIPAGVATGGLVGTAALDYAIARCAPRLDARFSLPRVTLPPAAAVFDPCDLVYGAAGVVLASSSTPASWWDAVIATRGTQPPATPCYPISARRRLSVLPGRRSVLALVARRLGQPHHDPPPGPLGAASELALVTCGSSRARQIFQLSGDFPRSRTACCATSIRRGKGALEYSDKECIEAAYVAYTAFRADGLRRARERGGAAPKPEPQSPRVEGGRSRRTNSTSTATPCAGNSRAPFSTGWYGTRRRDEGK